MAEANTGLEEVGISRCVNGQLTVMRDVLAVEEPLEIRLEHGAGDNRIKQPISVTMRTPGNDRELALGFLYTEGIIGNKADIQDVVQVNENVVLVSLVEKKEVQLGKLERNFYTTSSCGVCGKASIDAIKTVCQLEEGYPYDQLKVSSEVIYGLPQSVSVQQGLFTKTGGIHASVLFDSSGTLLFLREDVGRHNAMDKLVGKSLNEGLLPLNSHLLFLSGRASFELVQKAAMAGIRIIVAVGAPSSLAVQMAEEWNMTLVGFLRGEKFNIYCGAQRVVG